jgi:hypothetical protein
MVLNEFQNYAKSEINKLFGVTYDQEKYTQVSESIQEIETQFYT